MKGKRRVSDPEQSTPFKHWQIRGRMIPWSFCFVYGSPLSYQHEAPNRIRSWPTPCLLCSSTFSMPHSLCLILPASFSPPHSSSLSPSLMLFFGFSIVDPLKESSLGQPWLKTTPPVWSGEKCAKGTFGPSRKPHSWFIMLLSFFGTHLFSEPTSIWHGNRYLTLVCKTRLSEPVESLGGEHGQIDIYELHTGLKTNIWTRVRTRTSKAYSFQNKERDSEANKDVAGESEGRFPFFCVCVNNERRGRQKTTKDGVGQSPFLVCLYFFFTQYVFLPCS